MSRINIFKQWNCRYFTFHFFYTIVLVSKLFTVNMDYFYHPKDNNIKVNGYVME